MQPRQSWFLGIVIVLLLFLIFAMPFVGMRLRWLMGPQSSAPSDAQALMAQNESLQAQLSELRAVANELPPNATPGTIHAMVYSEYPFNFKSTVTVGAGSADGAAPGDAVLFGGNLIGFISGVSAHESVAQTVFDPNFKLQVRIGAHGYDALLVGGSYPMAESIAKTAVVTAGDVVYSAAPGMPYAIPVGTVENVSLAPNNLFEQAALSFPYDMSNVQAVEILGKSSS